MKLEKLFGPACKFSQPSVYFFPFFLVLTVRSHFIYCAVLRPRTTNSDYVLPFLPFFF